MFKLLFVPNSVNYITHLSISRVLEEHMYVIYSSFDSKQ